MKSFGCILKWVLVFSEIFNIFTLWTNEYYIWVYCEIFGVQVFCVCQKSYYSFQYHMKTRVYLV